MTVAVLAPRRSDWKKMESGVLAPRKQKKAGLETDREQARAERITNWKKKPKIEKVRKKMGAKSSQPSIKDGWIKRADPKKKSSESTC